MGWNSWDAYGFTVDESAFKDNATVLARFSKLGWSYAIIDEGWYMQHPEGGDRESRQYLLNANGLLMPALDRFPSADKGRGLAPLANWTHRQGLRFGIHIVRGIPKGAVLENDRIAGSAFRAQDAADREATCPWDDGNYGVLDNAAGQAYYDSMFKLYARWKVDFVKVDCISNLPYRASEIRQIATAIRHSGRPMVLSLSPGPTQIVHASEVSQNAQMWRITNDIWDGWSFDAQNGVEFPIGIGNAFDSIAQWAPYARPGHWPDADMLPIGELRPHPGWGDARTSRLTPAEQQTQFVLWAISHSPLILGCNLTLLDDRIRDLLANKALIGLNQGPRRSSPVPQPFGHGDSFRAWISRPLVGGRGDIFLALFNVSSQTATLRASWRSLGITHPVVVVEDVLRGSRVGNIDDIDVQLGPPRSAVYRLR